MAGHWYSAPAIASTVNHHLQFITCVYIHDLTQFPREPMTQTDSRTLCDLLKVIRLRAGKAHM